MGAAASTTPSSNSSLEAKLLSLRIPPKSSKPHSIKPNKVFCFPSVCPKRVTVNQLELLSREGSLWRSIEHPLWAKPNRCTVLQSKSKSAKPNRGIAQIPAVNRGVVRYAWINSLVFKTNPIY